MDLIDFSRIAYKSANTYLKYVRENGKSRETINVISIKEIENRLFYVRISKKLYQIDSTYFVFNFPLIKIEEKEDELATNKRIRILEYDESEPSIIVGVDDSFYETFVKLKADEILLVSDLSFLIEATRDWYRDYHERIALPPRKKRDYTKIIAPSCISSEQQDAAKTVLTSPISYVWGAPGTGKTQVVLSSCIATIIDSDSSVLVVAPTNNAIEQSLNGIIRTLDENKIDIDLILRMGKASREFSLKYPDLCEKGSIMKEISQIENEIKIIEKKFSDYDSARRIFPEKDKILSLYQEKNSVENAICVNEEKNKYYSNNEKAIVDAIGVNESKLTELKNAADEYYLNIRLREIFEPFNDLFEKIKEIKENLNGLIDKDKSCISIGTELEAKRALLEENILSDKNKIASLNKKINSLGFRLKSIFGGKQRKEAIDTVNEINKAVLDEENELEKILVQIESNKSVSQEICTELEENNNQLCAFCEKAKCIMGNVGFYDMNIEDFHKYLNKSIELYDIDDFNVDDVVEKIDGFKASILSMKQSLQENADKLRKNNDEKINLYKDKDKICCNIIKLLSEILQEPTNLSEDLGEKFVLRLLSINVTDEAYESLKKRLKEKRMHFDSLKKIVGLTYEKKRIFACTVDYLILHYAEFVDLIKDKLKQIFLDESAYCSMIKTSPLFSLDVPVAFFGDHMQLPPICEMENKGVVDKTTDLSFLWSQSSLFFPDVFCKNVDFEDLRNMYYGGDDPKFEVVNKSVLTNTYRFGQNLAKVLDSFVYKTGFSGIEKDTQITVIDAPRLASETELRENHSEAAAIKEYLKNNSENSLIILTPYKKQRDLIQKELRYKREVSTIHASQGREWDTVILSVVDTERKFFTDSINKQSKGLKIINTAISRAKKHLIIVCDKTYWETHKNKQLIGSLVSTFSD